MKTTPHVKYQVMLTAVSLVTRTSACAVCVLCQLHNQELYKGIRNDNDIGLLNIDPAAVILF